ncbi:MAG: hypothetical protein JW840_01945 [Candidatus Thermoplasmatota archaeon]|nr:hypothetical protein [Candidatus Thermoplasmatota archaeon]
MKWIIMKKIIMPVAFVLILLLSAGVSAEHHIALSTTTTSQFIESTFYNEDIAYMTITITPPQIVFDQRIFEGQAFATLTIPGDGVTTEIGQAQLPMISRFVEIPSGATPELLIESVSWETTSLSELGLPAHILPVQPPLLKVEGSSVPFTMDDIYYERNTMMPSSIASASVLGELRGRSLALLQISPVQYIPSTGDLRVMTQCSLRMNLPGSDLAATARSIDRYTTPSYQQLFATSFINYGMLQGAGSGSRQEGYLIIVYDTFNDEILPFASWKQSQGFDTTVTMTSQIPGGPTKENIKAYILNAYQNWPTPPSYVLLVGDTAQIPAWTGSATGSCTDLTYATLAGSDYFADIGVGRFPAAQETEVTAMVDKTIFYEQGVFLNESFIKKAVFMASNDNYAVSEGTHNYVIDNYLTPNGYTCNKLYSHTYSATTQQVRNAFNDGRSLGIYSGHGSTTSWADGPPFSQSDVRGLTNADLYPFVASHACLTGQFSVSECFAETWLRVADKGSITFWSASESTYWGEDDVLEKKMFSAWWDDDFEMVSGMTNKALYSLWQHYSGGGLSQYYLEAYNVMGDPSLVIWRDSPNPNIPPDTPGEPTGPTTGQIGREYTFSATTMDPEGDNISFKFDWGDGTSSEWIGPVASGGIVSDTYEWAAIGSYDIKVKARDESTGRESGWSPAHTIAILEAPLLKIDWVNGGVFRVTSLVKNNGGVPASNVEWSITLTGGAFIGKETTGQITSLAPGEQQTISSKIILGFGATVVTVNVSVPESSDMISQAGSIMLFFVRL